MISDLQNIALKEIRILSDGRLISKKAGRDVVKISTNHEGDLFGSSIRHIDVDKKKRILELIGEFKHLEHLDLRRSRLFCFTFLTSCPILQYEGGILSPGIVPWADRQRRFPAPTRSYRELLQGTEPGAFR